MTLSLTIHCIRLPELNLRLPGCQPPRMFQLILHLLRGPLRSRESLILDNVALRHQLQVLSRGKKRPTLKNRDRMVWMLLRRVWQGWRNPRVIVQPETVIRWHRRGFRAFRRS